MQTNCNKMLYIDTEKKSQPRESKAPSYSESISRSTSRAAAILLVQSGKKTRQSLCAPVHGPVLVRSTFVRLVSLVRFLSNPISSILHSLSQSATSLLYSSAPFFSLLLFQNHFFNVYVKLFVASIMY